MTVSTVQNIMGLIFTLTIFLGMVRWEREWEG